jgi:hypothetical protein
MATEKVSLTLDEDLVSEAREAVGTRGLSGYVNRALRQQLQRDRLAGLLEELEQENGPIEPRVMEEARRAWPAQAEREAGGALILTGDREDLQRLAATHPEVWVHTL